MNRALGKLHSVIGIERIEPAEMSTYDKSALERCRTQIVKDLDIRHIVDDLIATNVIDENHYDLIKNQVRSFLLLYNGGKALCNA